MTSEIEHCICVKAFLDSRWIQSPFPCPQMYATAPTGSQLTRCASWSGISSMRDRKGVYDLSAFLQLVYNLVLSRRGDEKLLGVSSGLPRGSDHVYKGIRYPLPWSEGGCGWLTCRPRILSSTAAGLSANSRPAQRFPLEVQPLTASKPDGVSLQPVGQNLCCHVNEIVHPCNIQWL